MADPRRERYWRTRGQMEDFWGRRDLAPVFSREDALFGRKVEVLANQEGVLAAMDLSLPQFSTVPAGTLPPLPPFRVQFGVRPARVPPEPPAEELMQQLWYAGDADWVMIHAGVWGQAFVDLAARRAFLLLAPELADRPDLVSRCLLNTVLLNLCLGNGDGMLHASCLEKEGRALLLLAPHNTGKSTTALRLVHHGFRLATDSMVHILPESEPPLLAGFPVGRLKLREDVLPHFPHLSGHLAAEAVREETKYVLDLRRVLPQQVYEQAFSPSAVTLCLLSRSGRMETTWSPAGEEEVWAAIMANSLFFDTAAIWENNLAQIERVMRRCRSFHLRIGHDRAGILDAVAAVWAA